MAMSTKVSNWTGVRFTCVALLVGFSCATPSVVLGQSAQTPTTLGSTMAITASGPVMGGSITLVWSAVPDATHYHARVEDAVTLQIDDYYPAEAAGCATGGGVCAVTLATTGFTPGTGQWTVQAWSATAEGPWTDPKLFAYVEVSADGTLDIGGAPAAPTTGASTSGLSDPGTLPATTFVVDSIVGTPKQVLVSGTSVVTLSTPQDIDTAANVQFTSADLGTTTLLASRALTVDTGGVFDTNLGTAAGDDFTVDTSTFVVEGDTGHVDIGTTAPLY